jgi:IMP dehydrogenase
MGSIDAMRQGSRDRYFQEEAEADKMVPEGIEGRVPYRGPLAESVFQLVGGVKAGMGLCGARNIAELWKKARFVQVTSAGVIESHPHGVAITKEAPNYRVSR